jgi:hypothetical protein
MSINHLISPDIEPKLDLYAKDVILEIPSPGVVDNWVSAGSSLVTSPNLAFTNIDIDYYNIQIVPSRVATFKFCGTLDVDILNLNRAIARLNLGLLPPVELYYSRFNIQSEDGAILNPSIPATAKLYLEDNQPTIVGSDIDFSFVLPLVVFSPTNSYISTNCTIDCEISYRY